MNRQKLALWMSWLIGGILALLPFHALLTTWVGSQTGHLDLWRIWKEILICLMIPPTIWLGWPQPTFRRWLNKSWLSRLILLYILIQLVWGFVAIHQHQVNKTALTYAWIIDLRFLGFFGLCLLVASYDGWLKRYWSRLLLIPAGIVLAFGLMQKFLLPFDWLKHFGYGPKTIPAYQTVDASLDFRRIQSTLRGANPLGAYLVLIITAFVASRWKKLGLQILMIAAGLTVLYFSYSRSAWLGLGVSLLALAWLSSQHKRTTNHLMAVTGVLSVMVAGIVYIAHFNKAAEEAVLHTSSTSVSASSNTERVKAIKQGFHDVVHQPLGKGPGTAGPASVRNNHKPRIAENYYLQIGQEVGWLGLAVFIAINIGIAKVLWRQRQDQLARILLASLAGISFINLLSHAWTDDTLSLLWWGLAGIELGSILKIRHKHHEPKVKTQT